MTGTALRGATWLVARWEFLTRVRSKLFLSSTLAIPLLILGLIYLPLLMLEDDPPCDLVLAIVDQTGQWEAAIGQRLDERYGRHSGQPHIRRHPLTSPGLLARQGEAAALLEAGVIDAYLVIEVGFDETGRVGYVPGASGYNLEQERLRRVVQNAWTQERLRRQGLGMEQLAILERGLEWSTHSPEGVRLSDSEALQMFMTPIAYVMILFFAIFFSSQMLMRGIITERSNRVVEMLLSSVSARDLLQGKIIGLGLIGLTQLGVYLLVIALAGPGRSVALLAGPGLGYFVLFALLGYFFYAAVYASLGSLFETEQEAQQIAGLLALLPVLPLVFSAYVIARPEALVLRWASFFPPVTPFLMIMRLSVAAVPWWEVAGSALVLALFTGLIMRWAGAIFRTTILLYGQKVSWKEIARWARAR